MLPHEERVLLEKEELDTKLAKLKAFCFGSTETTATFRALDPVDRDLLEQQYTVMHQYSKILEQRIARFHTASKS